MLLLLLLFIARDSELRDLRKKVTDQEQEVCILDKHIENMENVSTKLGAINEQLKAGCSKYEHYLTKLRSRLLDAFSNTAFPGKYFKLIKEIDLLLFTNYLINNYKIKNIWIIEEQIPYKFF